MDNTSSPWSPRNGSIPVESDPHYSGGAESDTPVLTYVGGFVVLLGITGSILSLSALRLEKKNNATTLLLKTMLLSDLLMVLTYGLWISTEEVNRRFLHQARPPYCKKGYVAMATAVAYTRYILPPVLNFAGCADSWSTVLVSVNRYVAICRPESAGKWYTLSRTRLQVGVMFLCLLAVNAPLFFTTFLRRYSFGDCIVYLPRAPRSPAQYLYEYAVHPLLQHVVPLTVLLPLNVCVIRSLRRARIYHRQLLASVTATGTPHARELNKVMNSIVWISLTVFVLHLPLFVMRMLFMWVHLGVLPDMTRHTTKAVLLYTADLSGLLYVSNSCINLIVYFFLRKTFRKKVFRLCCSSQDQ